jgi:hypothetical protein
MTEQSVHKTPPASPLQSIEEQDSPNFVPSTETFNQTRDDRVGDPKAQSENTKKQQQQHESQSPQSSRLKQRPQTGVVQHDHPSIQRQEQSQSALPTRASMNRQPTASGSFYCGCGVTSQRRPSLYSKVASQNAIQTVPSHTVAGPNTMNGQSTQGPVYQDPEYQSMNPRYGKDNEKPVWGLAKPLPRVVRPGMRRNETTDQKSYNTNPRGEAEPAPELGATPGLANSRSNATDRRTAPPPPQHPPTYASAAQEGLPQEYAVCEAQPDGLLRPMENEVEDGSRTTQEENMVQPPREEFLNQWVRVRHLLKEPFAEWLAVSVRFFSYNESDANNLYCRQQSPFSSVSAEPLPSQRAEQAPEPYYQKTGPGALDLWSASTLLVVCPVRILTQASLSHFGSSVVFLDDGAVTI